MQQKIQVQVIFTAHTDKGDFTDALYFSSEQYQNMSQSDIDKLQQERVDNWLSDLSAAAEQTFDGQSGGDVVKED